MDTTIVDNLAALRELIPPPLKFIREGKTAALDSIELKYLRVAPLAAICVSTNDHQIKAELIGGVRGFLQTEDVQKLNVPATQVECPPGCSVGIELLTPGVGETIRVNGHVDSNEEPGRITVDEVYSHCGKAFMRSNLWQSDMHGKVAELEIDEADGQSSILTKNMQTFLGYSPFAFLATASAQGADISPRGDPAGFLQVIDNQTLFLPDRPGNRRADSFQNILASPAVALLVLVPNSNAILYLHGTARISQDQQLLQQAAVKGKTPALGLLIEIKQAALVPSPVIQVSSMWNPSFNLDPRQVVSGGEIAADKIKVPTLLKGIATKAFDRILKEGYKHDLY